MFKIILVIIFFQSQSNTTFPFEFDMISMEECLKQKDVITANIKRDLWVGWEIKESKCVEVQDEFPEEIKKEVTL